MRLNRLRTTSRLRLCAWLVLLSSALAAADKAKDEKSPKAAVRAFIEAIEEGDERAVLAAYAPIQDKEQADAVQLFVDLLVAPRQLHAAVKQRFGDKAKKSEVYKIGEKLTHYLERAARRAARAKVEVNGDSAVVKLSDREPEWELLNPIEHDIALRKVDGRWRIDLPATLGVEKLTELTGEAIPREMKKRLPVLKKFAKAIEAGKYKDVQAFLKEYQAWHDNELEDPFKE